MKTPNSEYKVKLILSALLLFCFSIYGKAQSAPKKLVAPSPERFQAINDSILVEGMLLYTYEKLAWQATDSLMKYNVNRTEINSATAIEDGNLTWRYIFANLEKEQTVFELTFHLSNDTSFYVSSATPRKLKPNEIELLKAKQLAPRKVIKGKGDSIFLANTSGLNWDLLPLEKGGYRLYLLHGTTKHGVIPIGDDYSFDLDKEMNVLSWRRYHRSFLEQPITMNGEEIKEVMHSHTQMTPYFTATDIANYMLYGHDLYRIKKFLVLSTAFADTSYLTTFDVEKMKLTSTVYSIEKH